MTAFEAKTREEMRGEVGYRTNPMREPEPLCKWADGWRLSASDRATGRLSAAAAERFKED
jgi:hypothetical protein